MPIPSARLRYWDGVSSPLMTTLPVEVISTVVPGWCVWMVALMLRSKSLRFSSASDTNTWKTGQGSRGFSVAGLHPVWMVR